VFAVTGISTARLAFAGLVSFADGRGAIGVAGRARAGVACADVSPCCGPVFAPAGVPVDVPVGVLAGTAREGFAAGPDDCANATPPTVESVASKINVAGAVRIPLLSA
jgi:hypothetical protein